MKNFYLLIILLVSAFGFAQAPELGSYEIVFNGWAYGDEHHNCGNASVTLEFSTPADNYKALDFTYTDDRATVPYNVPTTFKADKTPVSMFFTASRYDRQSCRGNRPNNSGRITTTNKFRCLDYDFQFNQFKDVVDEGEGLASSSFNVKVRPILVIADPGEANELPTEKLITIKSNTGFFRSEYNWQYSFNPSDPNSWIDMPQFSGESSFTTNAKGILGENAGEYHGRTISFRQKTCNAVSDPVHYIVRQSAPEIVSKIEEKTKCFDTKDGKLIMKFDRPLFVGEKMTFSIRQFDEKEQQWMGVVCTLQKPGDVISLDGTNSYEFPCDFSKGKYGITFSGFINGSNTGSPHTETNPFIFNIDSPTPVDFSITKKNDINCFGGSDGAIDVVASGGIDNGIYQYSTNGGVSWTTFLNGDKTPINGLPLGICYVKVRKLKDSNDTVGCIAKKSDNTEKVLSENIGQPLSALELIKITPFNPTFNKAENGKIVALISGGTLIGGNSYSYKWRNSKNEIIDAGKSSSQFSNNIVTITLNNVPADTYTLLVTDQRNCTLDPSAIPSLVVVLDDPEPIEITLKTVQGISCNTANLDPFKNQNKAADAIIEATVKGGVPFIAPVNNSLPYKFIWSKYNTVAKLWEKLDNYKTAIADNLPEGDYSLNVEDANGIVQGIYNTTVLETAIPTKTTITEPAELVLAFTSGNVSCYDGNNGWAIANVTKGKAPYTYKWFGVNGGVIEENKISQLIKGVYVVEVTDSNGCFIKGSISIDGPTEEVKISYKEIFTPTFSGATNGRIVAQITGGTPFDAIVNNGRLYNYEWRNSKGVLQNPTAEILGGIYTITLNDVPADDYFLTIKDKNYNEGTNQIINCSVLESKVTLNEPDPLKVVFEITRTISCNTSNEFGNDKDTTPKDGQRDESQDGILVAHVTGGTPLAADKNNGLPYYFYWKKQQADGSWKGLAIQDSIAPNLSHGNYALNVKDRNGIMLGTYVNNVLTQEIDVTQLMQEPPKLAVTITHGDVFCNEGNDGWATAHVVGGTPPYEYKWSNEVEIDENTVLKAGEYWVFITDAKGCTTQESVTILQPITPLAIKYTEVLNPSFYKATNGKIVVDVTGGTILPDNSYWFEWKNSKGITQTTTTTSFNNGAYTIILNGLPEETYSLTVRDANYDAATNKISCTVVNSVTTLDDPDPLEVTFEVVRTISCNVSNEFGNETDANPQDNQRDESQDGLLVAHVKGGIQLKTDKNNGLPYFYTWKKQQKDGSWIIWNNHDETAENLSHGTYALNIEDANGIKLGSYVNNVLIKEIDVTQFMPEPAKLILTFTKLNASCNNGDDGWAEALVTGGTAPYTYEWTNGATTAKIENITTNNYFVVVTDAKGCIVQGSIFVGDPKGILTTETVKNPTCYKGNDGAIQLNVTGGNLPYSYLWNTGATTKDLNNLTAGNYEVTIICPDCCIYKKKFILKDPNPIVVDLGKDRTLCNDQVLDLDATIADQKAQYNWTSTNGFTSNQAKVGLTKAGTYHVKVTSALGCIGEDEIVIKTNKAVISSEFLLSSQAYLDEEVILVNTSNPFGESTKWVIPKGVKIVEEKEKYITLKFDAKGVYSIGLQQTQGDCYATYNKSITVEQRSTLPNAGTMSNFITDFIVTPNPSDGNFKAVVNLENNSAINLRLFSTAGEFSTQKKDSGKKKYEVDFNTSLQSGMYILVLETEQQTLVKKIIIY
ncbi:T9SS type A sorting domain-containing protein [uncultured Flavobacterium sp.]|uniref:T9SS type A sorting domain-containing protein n=1 Tax=uncultured Flavobacterium sp. TaxID=165435 RepID=UPI0029310075|nr:T9SS type A sorting domain-containing protein [uncultured Flavobacterium sp.]